MVLKKTMSEALGTLETALSALRDQVEVANRLAERLNQACDASALAAQALAKLQAERDGAEALRIQLESDVERLRVELAEARRRPWWE